MTWSAIAITLLAFILAPPAARGDTHAPQLSLQVPEHVLVGVKPKQVQIDVFVTKGFHVQANPASREGLIPTEIQLEPSPLFLFSSYTYPKGNPLRLAQGTSEILTYSGNFQIGFLLARQPPTALPPIVPAKDKQLIKGQIHYQACDDHVCMRPASVPFEFWVESPK